MTTIVNSPPVSENNNSGTIIGIFIVLVISLVFVFYGIPVLKRMSNSQINVPAPVINMPDKVDVNVQPAP